MKELLKRRILALNLFNLTRKRYISGCDIPVVSFHDLSIPFQAPIAMDLRNLGLCSLSCDANSNCGLILNRDYVSLTTTQYIEVLKQLNIY